MFQKENDPINNYSLLNSFCLQKFMKTKAHLERNIRVRQKTQKFKNQILQSCMSLRYLSVISIQIFFQFEAHFDHPQSSSILQRD